MTEESEARPAMLLVATEGDWAGRSLESVLTLKGHSVLRTQSGRDAVALARRTRPDAVLVDQRLSDVNGFDVCRRLRDDPTFDPATPLIVIAGSPASRDERVQALSAGAWAFWTQPLDTELLVYELETFLRAKRASAASRDASLVDPDTGLLTPKGLERWAEQLTASAARKHEPLACVVLMPVMAEAADADADDADAKVMADALAALSQGQLRQSDILGRTADGRLAFLAPDTDDAGVVAFMQRLRRALDKATAKGATPAAGFDFRAGFYATDDFSTSLAPAEMIRRASRAVDHATQLRGGDLAFNFKEIPLN
jgi:DNA-binding response OmpR family regulator